MTLINPFRDEGAADGILAVAEKHYEGALLALADLTVRLEENEDLSLADFQRAARDVRLATQALFDERKRVETSRKRDVGLAGDFGFDFDAARSEVRGLLDRLRAARSSS